MSNFSYKHFCAEQIWMRSLQQWSAIYRFNLSFAIVLYTDYFNDDDDTSNLHPAGRALISDWLPPATEGNVFTGVWQSFCPQIGRGYCPEGVLSRGGCEWGIVKGGAVKGSLS